MALRLLQGGSAGRDVAKARLPSLAAQPFRPGELVMPICISLGAESGACAGRHANAAGLPVELWARLAIEGGRQLARAVTVAGLERDALSARLDELATQDERPVIGLATRGLSGYAHLLQIAEPTDLRQPQLSRLTLLIPDVLALGWTRAAKADGKSLSAWSDERVLTAPANVVKWEAAAAATGDSLGEWILAAALPARN